MPVPTHEDTAAPLNGATEGALTGVRVLEIGSIVAGPFAGRLLADHGADVIKIEAPGRPDPLRDWGQHSYRGHRLWWTVHARNKRCVTLDLRSERGQELFLELVRQADVVIENFRPGTLERWNLGYDRLSEANRGLVLARVSGYGQTGPYRHRPGYASVAEAMGGLRAINGFPGQAPPRMAVSLGDSLAGMFAVQGVLAALLHRQRTGQGQMVDVALTESSLALLESVIPEYDRLGKVRQPSGTRLDGIAPSNLFRSKDEKWVIVAANQDTVFRRLCDAMDRPGLADDPRFATHVARGENQEIIESIVEDWVRERTADEVLSLLEEADVVASPVYTAADIVADPQFQARDMLVPHHDERLAEDVLGPGVVPRLTGTPGSVRWAGPPEPGWHNDEVYGRLLGLTPDEIAELRAESVV
jgi:formyl-CoA transferase